MPDPHSVELLQAQWDNFEVPTPGQTFRHYKGGEYEIITTGFIESNQKPCIVYKSLADNTIWVRTAEDFFELIEHQSKRQPRFLLIS